MSKRGSRRRCRARQRSPDSTRRDWRRGDRGRRRVGREEGFHRILGPATQVVGEVREAARLESHLAVFLVRIEIARAPGAEGNHEHETVGIGEGVVLRLRDRTELRVAQELRQQIVENVVNVAHQTHRLTRAGGSEIVLLPKRRKLGPCLLQTRLAGFLRLAESLRDTPQLGLERLGDQIDARLGAFLSGPVRNGDRETGFGRRLRRRLREPGARALAAFGLQSPVTSSPQLVRPSHAAIRSCGRPSSRP